MTDYLILRDAGRFTEAQVLVEQRLRTAPDDPEALAQLAHLHVLQERLPEAAQAIQAAAGYAPDHPAVLAGRARLALRGGDSAAAKALVAKALEAEPTNPEARLILANAEAALGNVDEARRLLEEILAGQEMAEAFASRAMFRSNAGDVPGAISDLQRATALKPHLVNAWRLLANLCSRSDQHEAARCAWLRAVGQKPDLPDAAIALTDLGPLEAALAAFAACEEVGSLGHLGRIRWLQAARTCDQDTLVFYRAVARASTSPKEHAELAAFAAAAAWADLRFEEALALVHQHYMAVAEPSDRHAQMARAFLIYVGRLAINVRGAGALYKEGEAPTLHAIGDSHSLGLSGALIPWRGGAVRGCSRFIMGVKMFHLGSGPNFYILQFDRLLARIPAEDQLLLCVGEIDSRPTEGMWVHHKKTGAPLAEIVAKTVDGYVAFLSRALEGRKADRITLQGVHAPVYAVPEDEREAFSFLIPAVNAGLASAARERGWGFLDLFTPTAGNPAAWRLDDYHLQPQVYLEAPRWLA